ncbi:MAG: hypothetical protein E7180_02840 [Erysipelotrichaceae bacterium]|nr:hypothetical protein [Erysipelotrichaceae bacterium]
MQIKNVALAFVFIIHSSLYNTEDNEIFFEDAYLVYYDNKYHFNFSPLENLYDSIEVYLNDEIIFEHQFIKNISSIPLEGLKSSKSNKIDFYLVMNKVRSHYEFEINIDEDISLDSLNYISFNDFIDDYTNCISFYEEQYFKIENHEYEIQGNNKFLNIEDFIKFTFNDKYDLCDSITLVIYNNNLFENFKYEYGYHFLLKETKNDIYYLDFYNVDKLSKYEGLNYFETKLYFPKELNQNIIDCKITFNSLYHSGVDLSFEQVVDINSFFLEEGCIYIKSVDQINANADFYEL